MTSMSSTILMANDHEHEHEHGDHEDHSSYPDSKDSSSWLFSFGASDVQVRPSRNGKHKGRMTFSFDADNCSKITAFTDRPDRLTRQLSMKPFANDFNDLFGDDKPNASLTSWQEGEFHNHAFEIYSIKRKNGQYHLKTDLLEGT